MHDGFTIWGLFGEEILDFVSIWRTNGLIVCYCLFFVFTFFSFEFYIFMNYYSVPQSQSLPHVDQNRDGSDSVGLNNNS